MDGPVIHPAKYHVLITFIDGRETLRFESATTACGHTYGFYEFGLPGIWPQEPRYHGNEISVAVSLIATMKITSNENK